MRKVKLNENYDNNEVMKAIYEKVFDILMEYWNLLPEDAKEDIDQRLKALGI